MFNPFKTKTPFEKITEFNRLALKTDNPKKALSYTEQALACFKEYEKSSRSYLVCLINKARELQKLKKYKESLEICETILSLKSYCCFEAMETKIDNLDWLEESPETLLKLYDELLKFQPDRTNSEISDLSMNRRILFHKAKLYFKMGRHKTVLFLLDKYRRPKNYNPDETNLLSESFFAPKDILDIIEACEKEIGSEVPQHNFSLESFLSSSLSTTTQALVATRQVPLPQATTTQPPPVATRQTSPPPLITTQPPLLTQPQIQTQIQTGISPQTTIHQQVQSNAPSQTQVPVLTQPRTRPQEVLFPPIQSESPSSPRRQTETENQSVIQPANQALEQVTTLFSTPLSSGNNFNLNVGTTGISAEQKKILEELEQSQLNPRILRTLQEVYQRNPSVFEQNQDNQKLFHEWIKKYSEELDRFRTDLKITQESIMRVENRQNIDDRYHKLQEEINRQPKLKKYQESLLRELNCFIVCYFLAPTNILRMSDSNSDTAISVLGAMEGVVSSIPVIGQYPGIFLRIFCGGLSQANTIRRFSQINRLRIIFTDIQQITEICRIISMQLTIARKETIIQQTEPTYSRLGRIKEFFIKVKEEVNRQWQGLAVANTAGVTLLSEEKLAVLDCAFLLMKVMTGKIKINRDVGSNTAIAEQFVRIISENHVSTSEGRNPANRTVTNTSSSAQFESRIRNEMKAMNERLVALTNMLNPQDEVVPVNSSGPQTQNFLLASRSNTSSGALNPNQSRVDIHEHQLRDIRQAIIDQQSTLLRFEEELRSQNASLSRLARNRS